MPASAPLANDFGEAGLASSSNEHSARVASHPLTANDSIAESSETRRTPAIWMLPRRAALPSILVALVATTSVFCSGGKDHMALRSVIFLACFAVVLECAAESSLFVAPALCVVGSCLMLVIAIHVVCLESPAGLTKLANGLLENPLLMTIRVTGLGFWLGWQSSERISSRMRLSTQVIFEGSRLMCWVKLSLHSYDIFVFGQYLRHCLLPYLAAYSLGTGARHISTMHASPLRRYMQYLPLGQSESEWRDNPVRAALSATLRWLQCNVAAEEGERRAADEGERRAASGMVVAACILFAELCAWRILTMIFPSSLTPSIHFLVGPHF
eukprot:CAMPEP_0119380318 /NCGR_PEP_ID=MMETSP1334-20130426/56441_1 /TAXON_ID=127549 /ORGANISM="Calcidiscus leptoporus, Strain RCC1130" /LENGTH=326 /DNA_ID=CAMNT_0007400101 /DNA_START=54 /DNA_END=1034 /DNA_ORIENTATION=+